MQEPGVKRSPRLVEQEVRVLESLDLIVKRHGVPTTSEIARVSYVDGRTVRRTLERLRRSGLVLANLREYFDAVKSPLCGPKQRRKVREWVWRRTAPDQLLQRRVKLAAEAVVLYLDESSPDRRWQEFDWTAVLAQAAARLDEED
jgi:hypothetical protein